MSQTDNNAPPRTTGEQLLSTYFRKENKQAATFDELLQLSDDNTDEALVRLIIDGANDMMYDYASKITPTQLRNVFANVKRKEFEGEKNYIKLLRAVPKLAYMEGRPQKDEGGEKIIAFIRELAFEVRNSKQYEAFAEIMDTLVAYHKVHAKNKK